MGARYVFHHMIWTTTVPGQQARSGEDVGEGSGTWPIHEVGRNADVFPDDAGKLFRAGSSLVFASSHIHSNGRDTKARLLFGFKFFPKGYKPTVQVRATRTGQRRRYRHQSRTNPISGWTPTRFSTKNTKITSFEPHLHAPGVRMCLEYIWGINVQTLSCAGYDHNWVRVYEYDDDYAPLLPKGTILHIIGYMDNDAGESQCTGYAGTGRDPGTGRSRICSSISAKASRSRTSSSTPRWPNGARS